jgi:hypothetical protein
MDNKGYKQAIKLKDSEGVHITFKLEQTDDGSRIQSWAHPLANNMGVVATLLAAAAHICTSPALKVKIMALQQIAHQSAEDTDTDTKDEFPF